MIRALVQFDDDTYQRLRAQAYKQKRSIASVVRDAVAKELEASSAAPRVTSIRQMSSVRAGRSTSRRPPVSEHHDEALAKAFRR